MKLIEKIAAIAHESVIDKDMSIQATTNPNGRHYAARSEGQVLGVFRPLFQAHKIHSVISSIDTLFIDANIIKIKVGVTFHDLESDDTVVSYGIGTGVDKSDKDTGKAFTYAVKNAYVKMFMAISGEDADNESSDVTEAQTRTTAHDVIKKMWDKWYFHDMAAKEQELDGEAEKVFAIESVVKRAVEMKNNRLTKAKTGKIHDVMQMTNTMNTLLKNM